MLHFIVNHQKKNPCLEEQMSLAIIVPLIEFVLWIKHCHHLISPELSPIQTRASFCGTINVSVLQKNLKKQEPSCFGIYLT